MFGKQVLYFLLLCVGTSALAQSHRVEGIVIDQATRQPLEYVNVLIDETLEGSTTDATGYFDLGQIDLSHFHLSLTHIGCAKVRLHVEVYSDTLLNIVMKHTDHALGEVKITAKASVLSTQAYSSIDESQIEDNAAASLADLTSKLAGVTSLNNGGSISKPIIHGLYGNRVAILNNGVLQSGQQWGNDHSPEIDPLAAQTIRVVKGVGALEYPDGHLGGIIMVEPQKIGNDPHLHGKWNSYYVSNGRGIGSHFQVNKFNPALSFTINGTIKRRGDLNTPNYYLTNTGSQENNIAIQLKKQHSKSWSSTLYLSSFNTALGILRGAHIGNLTDLEQAIGREEPFFTKEEFSREIQAPRQAVNHHLLKLSTQYFISDTRQLDLDASLQLNKRKEYDVRRSGRTDLPSLSLDQYTYSLKAKYTSQVSEDKRLKLGYQSYIIDNTNDPLTGILPLIPDYASYRSGVFALWCDKVRTSTYEVGLRYDYEYQSVATISQTVPREIIKYDNHLSNISASLGWVYTFSDRLDLGINAGYARRNPAINERYSNGLHQGVSGIELGDETLNQETSFKQTLHITKRPNKGFQWELLVYNHFIKDYIYLQPQEEVRLTVRGAFPVFKYEQTDALIQGVDIMTSYHITPSLKASLAYAYIRGRDLSQDLGLINIPSSQLTADIQYSYVLPMRKGKWRLDKLDFGLNSRYVGRQTQVSDSQDFLRTPDAYFLLSPNVVTHFSIDKYQFRSTLKIENLLNTRYRDYLNRQRYFADDLGRNIMVGLQFYF